MGNMGNPTLRVAMQRPSLRKHKRKCYSEGTRNLWKHTVAQRREDAMLQPPLLVLRHMPIVGPMQILRNRATLHPILSKLLTDNKYSMPLQATDRTQSIRLNMSPNKFTFHSIPFHLLPIPIPFILGVALVQADHLLLFQCNLWRRPQMRRALSLWQPKVIPIQTPFRRSNNNQIDAQRAHQGEGQGKIQRKDKWSSVNGYLQFQQIDMLCWG